ncbi:MAG: BMP family ABC transporter substrate-binding protein, partial [Bacteroidaceae bacterium]|nr:BMP family ABC transporter substrate-binding protein [Bacteroidaceae bacterium]
KGTIPRRLLVLASSDYIEPARRLFANAEMNINRCVLVFEAEDNGDETEQIRSFDIDMYGASWLAGRTAHDLGCKSPLVLLGNSMNATTYDARDGFVDGYGEAEDGTKAVVGAIADDYRGYGMPTELYHSMYDYDGKYDFIYAVAGGSNMGAYRYLRENPDCGIYTAGMDTDQSPYSTLIVGSMVKRIDLVLYDHLKNWYNMKDLPRYSHYGLDSGYIDWQIADRYAYLKASVEANRAEAIRKEKEYEAN